MNRLPEVTFDTLRGLQAGESSTVVGISAAHISAKRLADMGFVSGARIEMIRPGNPCLVRIGGICVGLGAANQTCILVANRINLDERNPPCGAGCPVCQEPPAPA